MERAAKYTKLIALVASAVVVAVLYLAKGVLIPFALAMLVSFLLAPLVLRLQRWHVPRILAVSTAMLLVVAATGAGTWLVVEQVRQVTASLTEHEQNLRDKMATLRDVVGTPVASATKLVGELGEEAAPVAVPETEAKKIQTVRIAGEARGPFELVRDAVGPVVDFLLTGAMVMLFAFVMLLHRDDLGDRFIRLVGHGQIVATTRALKEASRMVSGHLWRLLLLNGIHGLAVGIGLALIGVPNASLWGLLSAILRFIPFVGPWIAAAFPILTALAISPGWALSLKALGLFAVLEMISNNVLEPWIYGKGAGISTLAILVSALFWALLWGPVGLVLSIPLTVCLLVIGRHVPQLQFLQLLFSDTPGLRPASRLYQRLVAGDQVQAWLVLRAEMEKKSLQELYDAVVLPALSMAEEDRQRGELDAEAQGLLEETVGLLVDEAGELRAGPDAAPDSVPVPAAADSPRVLCLPARGAADALAAAMLRQVLERDGLQVEVSSIAELAGESLDRLASRGVDIVCLSAVPPSRFMHVRYLCKRIAARYPGLPIVAGMWTLEHEAEAPDTPLPVAADVHVVTSLAAARAKVRELGDSIRNRRRADGAVAGPAVAGSAPADVARTGPTPADRAIPGPTLADAAT
jgi:predicted PurR-regulated permease PerM